MDTNDVSRKIITGAIKEKTKPGDVLLCVANNNGQFTVGSEYTVNCDGDVLNNDGTALDNLSSRFELLEVTGYNATPDDVADEEILSIAASSSDTRLVSFSGHAGSGKSAAADLLVLKGWHRVKMADTLKDMLRVLYKSFGLSSSQIEERIEGSLKEVPDIHLGFKTPRHAMQSLGEDWGRSMIIRELWVNIWQYRVGKLLSEGYKVVCDDIRYQNEADIIRKYGGIVVKVVGHRARASSNHVSEALDFDTDVEIENTGTLGDLEMKIAAIL